MMCFAVQLPPAITTARAVPGAIRRTDVDSILRLLLAAGANPNERGVNDYTPLHMAVAERNLAAIELLLENGANANLRTRIDDYETPEEMARGAGLSEIADLLAGTVDT